MCYYNVMKKLITILAIAIVIAFGVGMGIRYLSSRGGAGDSSETIVGLWRSKELYSYIQVTKQWQKTDSSVGTSLFLEYKSDGTTCTAFSHLRNLPCISSATYSVAGDILKVNDSNTTGPEWRSRFSIKGGELDIVNEAKVENEWVPIMRAVLVHATRPVADWPAE